MALARKPANNITQILMWLAIRELRKFKLPQVERRAQCTYQHVSRYIKALQDGGYVAEIGQAEPLKNRDSRGRGQSIYQLTKDTGPKAPRYYAGTGQLLDPNLPNCELEDPLDRCWQAMRINQRRFTAAQLEEIADLPHKKCLTYLRKFARCGYVRVISQPGERPPEYRLARNSGSLCPVFFQDGRAFDPNDKAEYEPDQPLG
jgi:hypothetical protein